jgi:pimeloyl-ACP methyl ester carboxylesterase
MSTIDAPGRGLTYHNPAGRLAYWEFGDGRNPAMVFFHGLTSAPERFAALLDQLSRHLGITILAPYLPNHGPSSNHSSYQRVMDVLVPWAGQHLEPDSTFVGHSLGGIYAVALAGELEQANAVLPFSAPIGSQYTGVRSRLGLYRRLCALSVREGRQMTGMPESLQMAGCMRDTLRYAFLELPRFNHNLSVMASAPDFTAIIQRLADLSVPVIGVYGELDHTVRPSEQSLPMTDIVVPGVGHCLPMLPAWQSFVAELIVAVTLHRSLPPIPLLASVAPAIAAA